MSACLALSWISAAAAAGYRIRSSDSFVSSRGVEVPVTYVYPVAVHPHRFPLVVMAHGHGGSRNESGSFTRVAEELGARGIASIRMDFPGCGDSTESFTKNNLGNMLEDIEASRVYAVARPEIDTDRVGLFGWSMGGRLVLMLSERNDDFKAIATWAPAASPGAGSMIRFLGGASQFAAMKARAARDGHVPFTTRWGQHQDLGLKFFTDMEKSNPLRHLEQFRGSLLVVYGDKDDVVLPAAAESAIAAASHSVEVMRYTVKGADHGLGVFSNEPQFTDQAVETTVKFLADRL